MRQMLCLQVFHNVSHATLGARRNRFRIMTQNRLRQTLIKTLGKILTVQAARLHPEILCFLSAIMAYRVHFGQKAGNVLSDLGVFE